MKCRKCGSKAVVHMRQHRLALCKGHYLEWVLDQTQRFIKKYLMFGKNERILVAVSGGKDSLSLLDILYQLDYQVDALYIDLGIDSNINYSSRSLDLCKAFTEERNLHLLLADISKEYGATVPRIAEQTWRGAEKPCSVCGLIKRHVMNRVAREAGYHVLATGHNLDDEAAVLLSNTLDWNTNHLLRQSPVLEANPMGLVKKAKPLCRFYERDMAAYAILRGIEYISEECPFAEGSTTLYYKGLLNQLEARQPGAKLNFYLKYLQAKENGLFAKQADRGLEQLHTCPDCGQPTSSPGLCTFCRLMSKLEPAKS